MLLCQLYAYSKVIISKERGMLMSWYNPSQDEAADEYYASKSRYMNAANQRSSSMRAATACTMEKAAVAGIIGTCTSQKLNFEKRIEDIRTIVGAIEGNGGGNILISSMGGDLPNIISAFNASVGDADMSYHGSMKCSDITPANLSEGKYSREYQTGKETGILETPNPASMLSEVMNGMTNNSLMVSKYNRSEDWSLDHGTVGHPINWEDPEDSYVSSTYYYNTDGSYTGGAETEYMAEFMRINMTGSKAEKDYVSGYLSDSWRMMDECLKNELK